MNTDTNEMIQWRNIRKVVKAIADYCFESGTHPDYGVAHTAVSTVLYASDGLQVELEPLNHSYDTLTIADYEEVLQSHRELVRQLDVALNGEAGAAKQASLCDIVAQVMGEGIKSKGFK